MFNKTISGNSTNSQIGNNVTNNTTNITIGVVVLVVSISGILYLFI